MSSRSRIRDVVVGIATRYGLDGPGIESRWGGGRNFTHLSRPTLRPTHPPIQLVSCLSREESGLGLALNTHPHLSAEIKERVDLYLYFPSGPLWSVLG
jgi:hypothetical protein